MPKQTIEALVDGGKATAGPPLGPALGPMGVPIPKVIAAINERTRDMAGMRVPVRVTVDSATKEFSVEVGTPPISALILKELGLPKGSQEPGKNRVGDLTHEQAKRVAKIKFGRDDAAAVSQVVGTARSMGISMGKGAVTEEERKAYEAAKAAKAAEAAPKPAEAAAGEAAEPKPEEAPAKKPGKEKRE